VRDNVTGSVAHASDHLVNLRMILGELDLHPKPGRCEGPPLDLSAFKTQTAWDADFDGAPKGNDRVRGAYATPGASGWRLQIGLKR
jgi:hypothetical protein